jgi:hypothetical protein
MRKIHKLAVVGGTTAALLGAGIAFAAWTSNGTGTGTVQATTAKNLTVTGTSVLNALYPTGTQTVTVTVKNNNAYAVRLDSRTASSIAVAGGGANCTVASSLVTAQSKTYSTAGDDIAAGASITRDLTVSMGADSNNDCQGATFTVTYDAVSHRVA